jgi:nitrogen regulatory protein PII
MKKIEAIVHSFELEEVMGALVSVGIDGMTITDIFGDGTQTSRGVKDRSGEDAGDLFPKIRFDLAVSNRRSMAAVDTITRNTDGPIRRGLPHAGSKKDAGRHAREDQSWRTTFSKEL